MSAACCPNTMPALVNQPLHVAALQQQPVRCIHCLTCNEHVLQSITKSFFRIIPRLLHHVIGLRCQRSNELFRVLQESTLVPTLEQSHLRRIDLSLQKHMKDFRLFGTANFLLWTVLDYTPLLEKSHAAACSRYGLIGHEIEDLLQLVDDFLPNQHFGSAPQLQYPSFSGYLLNMLKLRLCARETTWKTMDHQHHQQFGMFFMFVNFWVPSIFPNKNGDNNGDPPGSWEAFPPPLGSDIGKSPWVSWQGPSRHQSCRPPEPPGSRLTWEILGLGRPKKNPRSMLKDVERYDKYMLKWYMTRPTLMILDDFSILLYPFDTS